MSKEAVGAKRSLEVQNQLSIPLIVSFLVGRQRFSRRCTKSVNMLQDARKNRGTRNFLTIPQGSRTKGVGYILQQHPSRAEQQLKNERGLIDYEWRASYNIQREKKQDTMWNLLQFYVSLNSFPCSEYTNRSGYFFLPWSTTPHHRSALIWGPYRLLFILRGSVYTYSPKI